MVNVTLADSVSAVTLQYDNAHAGGRNISVANASGTGLSNYDIVYGDATGSIQKRVVQIDAVAANKTYDGTTSSSQAAAYGTQAAEGGFVSGDNISYTQAYSSTHAGSVTLGLASTNLTSNGSGALDSDYDVQVTGPVAATIYRRDVTVSLLPVSKTYDGTLTATAQGANFSTRSGDTGLVGEDLYDLSGIGTYNSVNSDATTATFTNSNVSYQRLRGDSLASDYNFQLANGGMTQGTILKATDPVADTPELKEIEKLLGQSGVAPEVVQQLLQEVKIVLNQAQGTSPSGADAVGAGGASNEEQQDNGEKTAPSRKTAQTRVVANQLMFDTEKRKPTNNFVQCVQGGVQLPQFLVERLKSRGASVCGD
jgi:hypothetical protein